LIRFVPDVVIEYGLNEIVVRITQCGIFAIEDKASMQEIVFDHLRIYAVKQPRRKLGFEPRFGRVIHYNHQAAGL
jgi:hypothetical protein